MKPRLEPALPTKEDIDILCYTWPGRDWRRDRLYPIGHSISADRRDADLMWLIERVRIATRDARPTTYPKWPMVMILIRADAAMGLSWPNGEPL